MRDFTDKCVVLKVNDYRDDDRLARVLTAEHGLVSVLLRGVKKAKAKLKPFAQPFACFDTRFVSGKGAFLTPVEPMLILDGFGLSSDLKIFTAASVAAETTLCAIGDDESHTDIFLEFLRFERAVEASGDPYYQAAVYISRLLQISGFYREYPYAGGEPTSPVQMLGYAQRTGYEKRNESDMSRRALKYICSEFSRNFDVGIQSVDSIDLYK